MSATVGLSIVDINWGMLILGILILTVMIVAAVFIIRYFIGLRR